MPNYRRAFVAGGCWFFTANLLERRSSLLVDHIDALRSATAWTRRRYPFRMDAFVVLPDHIHAIWTLPPGDTDFSIRWRFIKVRFSRAIPKGERLSKVRRKRGERGIWQRRFAIPGVQLYSLQKGAPEKEIEKLPKGVPLIDLSPHISDFADTAAAVAQLDLVIMTDSAVTHLAGSMGKPVWVLLSKHAHWLWLTERADSPWYPSVRLFRPRGNDEWSYVFDSATAELMQLVGRKPKTHDIE